MDEIQIAKEKARKNIQAADHIAFMTYPLVKNNRLLLVIVEHLFLAMTNAMASILYHERHFKRSPIFEDNYETKRRLLIENCLRRYNLKYEYVQLMDDLKEIIVHHKNSPIEFTRKDSFVICSEEYKIKVINLDKIKGYITTAKKFINEMEEITGNISMDDLRKEVKNERILR